MSGTVRAFQVFDDGSGPALYAGGEFFAAGGVLAGRIAKWNGISWDPLGAGINGIVYTMVGFDEDGSGPGNPNLFVGGNFISAGGQSISHIARWNGSSWSSVGSFGGPVYALAVFDDGAGGGPALYGGGAEGRMKKWTGSSWIDVGGGMNNDVYALMVFDDDGPGPNPTSLYAGGKFNLVGGQSILGIARWNGSSWSALGPGTATVRALATFDDGTGQGPALYAGGNFTTVGSVSANGIARWDGRTWSGLGTGVSRDGGEATVFALFPSGTELYAGGKFTSAGGILSSCIARWDGVNWSGMQVGVYSNSFFANVYAIGASARPGAGVVCVGGQFTIAGSVSAKYLATWDGGDWSTLDAGGGVDNTVFAMECDQACETTDSCLYVGGVFSSVGRLLASSIARWDGTAWSTVGNDLGVGQKVRTIKLYDEDQDGPAAPSLIIGGDIYPSGRNGGVQHIGKLVQGTWAALGGGADSSVMALQTFDDDGIGPHQPLLYAGGAFTTAGGIPANRIATWNGTNWAAVGTGLDGKVYAEEVFDDGTGPALYVGGTFNSAGGNPATNIARWNGVSWSPLGAGITGGAFPIVTALRAFDTGTGKFLVAGGTFSSAGGVPVNNIASWDGKTWAALGTGVQGGTTQVFAMQVHDDGISTDLYVGGRFTIAGGVPAKYIAKWNGSAWSSVDTGVSYLGNEAAVVAMAEFADRVNVGTSLYVGGAFYNAGSFASQNVARWGCQAAFACPGDISPCTRDGVVNALDLLAIIDGWGPCTACIVDINADGLVNTADLLAILNSWGNCP